MRLAAAVIVVAFHWTFSGIYSGKIASIETFWPIVHVTQYGYLGVEIFFMISGYVILASARGKTGRRFAVGRALRLYPAFWVAMMTTALVTALWGQDSGLRTSAKQVVANLTMVPEWIGSSPVDGVYWTLVYELQFYLLVFLLLQVGLGPWVMKAIAVWSALLLGVTLLAPSLAALPYLGGYYALFCVGALISDLHRVGPRWWSVGALACASAVAVVKVHAVGVHQATIAMGSFRPWVSVAVVLAAGLWIASLGVRRVASLRLPRSSEVGALTYPLYLLHAHIGFIAITQLGTEANRWWFYPVLFFVMLAASWLLHHVVEVRMKPFWLRLFVLTIDRPLALIDQRREALTLTR